MSEGAANDLLPGDVVRILSFRDSAAVVLEASDKKFLIFVGPYEAEAIKREMRGTKVERPLTHDVVAYVMTGFDINVAKVVVSSIVSNIFCATLVLNRARDDNPDAKDEVRLDIRASDAIILALKTDNQIWISRQVIDAVEDVSDALEQIDQQFQTSDDDDIPGFDIREEDEDEEEDEEED